jgi:hypothetical protein
VHRARQDQEVGLYGDVADAAPEALIVVTGYPYLFESDPNDFKITAFNEATAAAFCVTAYRARNRFTSSAPTPDSPTVCRRGQQP